MQEVIFGKRLFKEKVRIRLDKLLELLRHRKFLPAVVNYLLYQISIWLKLLKPLNKPFYIMIEPTNICNLRCPLCPTGERRLKRLGTLMNFENFKNVVDELWKYLLEVNITNYGEPLLYKGIVDMVKYLKDRGIRVSLGTNGHFLTEDICEEMVKARIDHIYISLDGTTQKSYEKYRIGGDFQEVLDGIKRLVSRKKENNSRYPMIELQFIVMSHNEAEIPVIRKMSKDLGVDKLTLKPVTFNITDWGDKDIIARYRGYEPQNFLFRAYKDNGINIEWKEPIKNRCDYLWRGLVVLANGIIVPCCLDPDGVMKMGIVGRDRIIDVWRSQRYVNLRREILRNKRVLPLCRHCPGT